MNYLWERSAPKWKQINTLKYTCHESFQIPGILQGHYIFLHVSHPLDFVAKLRTSHMNVRGFAYPTLLIEMNDARSLSFSIFEKTPHDMLPNPIVECQEVAITKRTPSV